ncbi:MAG: pitrilysin family protein [bacterium]|nr:pitrilysin family protein [bacterium]
MYKLYKIKNGLRVLLAPMTETKAVTVLVLTKVGSRYETKDINGVSHFVEHLMFKGTKKRPTTLSISKELDSIGAEYNAFTVKDHTGYYIKARADKKELALEMLSDILFNSKFEAREIDRERGVIVEEINMYEDNPMMYMEDLFEQTVFGDHPLGWNIAGPKDVIRKVSRAKIFNYYKKYYQPANMLVVVAGLIDNSTLDLVKKYFSKQSVGKFTNNYKKATALQNKSQIQIMKKQTEQAQMALGFPAYSFMNEKLYALYLMSIILGGNMSSRLFTAIREKKGLCYFIRASVNAYQDIGTLMIQAGLDKSRLHSAILEILKELKKLKDSGVTKQELRKAKDYLEGKLTLKLETSDDVASWLAKQELLENRIISPAKLMAKLEKVSLQDIKKVANDIITTNKLNLSLIGPFDKVAEFKHLLKV